MRGMTFFFIPVAYIVGQIVVGCLAAYYEADQKRLLRLPPDDLNRPLQAQVFRRSLGMALFFLFLAILYAVVYWGLPHTKNFTDIVQPVEDRIWLRLMIGIAVYTIIGYVREYIYVDSEGIEIQGILRKRYIDGDEITDLVMAHNVIFMRVTGKVLPIILWDYKKIDELYEFLWEVRWRNSKIVTDELESNSNC